MDAFGQVLQRGALILACEAIDTGNIVANNYLSIVFALAESIISNSRDKIRLVIIIDIIGNDKCMRRSFLAELCAVALPSDKSYTTPPYSNCCANTVCTDSIKTNKHIIVLAPWVRNPQEDVILSFLFINSMMFHKQHDVFLTT